MNRPSEDTGKYVTDPVVFEKFLFELGYDDFHQLSDDGCTVYFATGDGTDHIFKFVAENNRWNWDVSSSIRHIEHEAEILGMLSDHGGISKLIRMHRMYACTEGGFSTERPSVESQIVVALEKEYIEGETLAKGRGLDHQADQLLEIITSLHDRGIARLDIKPRNVVFDRDGNPTLIDFGTAIVLENQNEDKFDQAVQEDIAEFEKYFRKIRRYQLNWKYSGDAGVAMKHKLDMRATGCDDASDFLARRKCVENLRKQLI